MPEGPEIFTSARDLALWFIGFIIDSIVHHTDRCLKGRLHQYFTGGIQISAIRSRGKKLIFDLCNDDHLVFSYLMEGRLLIQRNDSLVKHLHFTLRLRNPVNNYVYELYYYDTRPLGGLNYCHGYQELAVALSDVGVDLIQDSVTLDQWLMILAKTKSAKPISEILLHQQRFAGIGNYLRCDILYHCRINPFETLKTLTTQDLTAIYYSTITVLNASLACNGASVFSYTRPDGSLGTYSPLIYSRDYDSLGNKVVKMSSGTRTIHYVPTVQILKC